VSDGRSADRAYAVAPAAALSEERAARAPRGGIAALSIGALGVVCGDIGASPLYAIDQLFSGPAAVARTPANALGSISLAIWTITLIVAVKYALLVLRAENDGEGGVFALYGLLHKYKNQGALALLWLLMLGAGLLFGDGMITPAISVLSAVEGLDVATPAFAPFVIPITLGLLTGLFAIQFKGASNIGFVFGPVLIVWFVVIAGLGVAQIARQPQILIAFDPLLGLAVLAHAGFHQALLILGAMMLVVTGGEAMYADRLHSALGYQSPIAFEAALRKTANPNRQPLIALSPN
jgi:KUP system potassium uptake protein